MCLFGLLMVANVAAGMYAGMGGYFDPFSASGSHSQFQRAEAIPPVRTFHMHYFAIQQHVNYAFYAEQIAMNLYNQQQAQRELEWADSQLRKEIEEIKKKVARKHFLNQINAHFHQFGHPVEQEYVIKNGQNFILAKNIRTGLTNWLFELATKDDSERAAQNLIDFGHQNNAEAKETLAMLDKITSCISARRQMPLLVLTGSHSLNDDMITTEKNQQIINHAFFKIFFVEVEKKKFCYEILITKSRPLKDIWENVCQMEESDCGWSKIGQSFEEIFKEKYAKIFNGPREFVEHHLRMDLSDFLQIAGVKQENIRNTLKVCERHQLFTKMEHQKEETNKRKIKKEIMEILTSSGTINFQQPKPFEWMFRRMNEGKINQSLDNLRIYQDFIVYFNDQLGIPNFVIEKLDNKEKQQQLEKSEANQIRLAFLWEPDPEYERMLQPSYKEYKWGKNKHLNHGHLAPVHNHLGNQRETFFITNSAPQWDQMNSGHWRIIEEYARCLGEHVKTFVYTGTLFRQKEILQVPFEYTKLGEKVAVPTHFFKVILSIAGQQENQVGDKCWLESFIVPNDKGSIEVYLRKERVAISNGPIFVQQCRSRSYKILYESEQKESVQGLLAHYGHSLEQIEDDWEFRLFTRLAESTRKTADWPRIWKTKGGVEFDCSEFLQNTEEDYNNQSGFEGKEKKGLTMAEKLRQMNEKQENIVKAEQKPKSQKSHVEVKSQTELKPISSSSYTDKEKVKAEIHKKVGNISAKEEVVKNVKDWQNVKRGAKSKSKLSYNKGVVIVGDHQQKKQEENKKNDNEEEEAEEEISQQSQQSKGGKSSKKTKKAKLKGAKGERTTKSKKEEDDKDIMAYLDKQIKLKNKEVVKNAIKMELTLGENRPEGNYKINDALLIYDNTKALITGEFYDDSQLPLELKKCLDNSDDGLENKKPQIILDLINKFRRQWSTEVGKANKETQRELDMAKGKLTGFFLALNVCIYEWIEKFVPIINEEEETDIYIGDVIDFMRKKLGQDLNNAQNTLINYNKDLYKFEKELEETYETIVNITQTLHEILMRKYGDEFVEEKSKGEKETNIVTRISIDVKDANREFSLSPEEVNDFFIMMDNFNRMLEILIFYKSAEQLKKDIVILHNYLMQQVILKWGFLYTKYVVKFESQLGDPEVKEKKKIGFEIETLIEWIGENHPKRGADVKSACTYFQSYEREVIEGESYRERMENLDMKKLLGRIKKN